jgi:hypothetical protein
VPWKPVASILASYRRRFGLKTPLYEAIQAEKEKARLKTLLIFIIPQMVRKM